MLCFNIGHNFKKVGLDQKLRRLQKTERSTARKRNVKCIKRKYFMNKVSLLNILQRAFIKHKQFLTISLAKKF